MTLSVKFRKQFKNLLRNHTGDESKFILSSNVNAISLYNIFCSNYIRSMVAMAA